MDLAAAFFRGKVNRQRMRSAGVSGGGAVPMKRVPRGHPLVRDLKGGTPSAGTKNARQKGFQGRCSFGRVARAERPCRAVKPLTQAGSRGRLWSPHGEECCLQHITSPFLRSPVGSLRNGLWCSLTARGSYYDDCAPAKGGGRSDEIGLGCFKSRYPAASLILRDKRQCTMV